MAQEWWRSAIIYQVYPRSFADDNGDGTGDIRGIISRLPYLAKLNVDALWISPWYPSPLADGGYDVSDYRGIHPDFGTLAEADELIEKAHDLGIRVIIDIVPNHCSEAHPWFQKALAAAPGSPERDLFVFRDGKGPDGSEPPTNWGSLFGGPAWRQVMESDGTPGQWFLHIFAPEQPDWNWENKLVKEEIDDVLRFWFDRGVDGFRIDVADSMCVDPEMPDLPIDPMTGFGGSPKTPGHPYWNRPEVAEIHRRWRRVADEYTNKGGDSKMIVAEAYLPLDEAVKYVAPGRLHTTFNFEYMQCEWAAPSLKHVISTNLEAHESVGAPPTWVIGNHDTVRPVSRYGKVLTGNKAGTPSDVGLLLGEKQLRLDTDVALGRKRARAAALLLLGLPGCAYVYQGEELGLEEFEDLPDDLRQDPIWHRTNHLAKGRDGCRVPLPWTAEGPSMGFGPSGEPWLPQPEHWRSMSAADQAQDPDSMLSLYRSVLQARREFAQAPGLVWEDAPEGVLQFRRDALRVVVNISGSEIAMPAGEVIVASGPVSEVLPDDTAVWLRV